jgi:uncharacterized protein (DUF58 family)
MSAAATLRERFARWALRTRPPESAPVVLSQRRIYVLPTRAGLAYAFSLLVMLLGAINYSLSLGYALTFLLGGLGVVSILHTFRNLAGLRLSPGRAEPVFVGDTAHFLLVLDNPRAEERRLIRLRLAGGSADEVDTPPAATADVRLGLPTTKRGWLPLPRITIETTYPLGLVRAWSYAQPGMHCLVYPRPASEAPPPRILSAGSSGRMQENRGAEDFAGLRRHQPEDPPRHVAWKAAARQDAGAPLQTKKFTGAAAETIWIDWQQTPQDADEERRIAILARWVVDAHDAGLSWGLRLPGLSLDPASGIPQLHASLKALALHGSV